MCDSVWLYVRDANAPHFKNQMFSSPINLLRIRLTIFSGVNQHHNHTHTPTDSMTRFQVFILFVAINQREYDIKERRMRAVSQMLQLMPIA